MDRAQGLSASRGGRSQRRTAAGRSSGAAVVVLVLLSQLAAAVVVLVLSYWRGKAPARGACHPPQGGCLEPSAAAGRRLLLS